MTAQDILLYLGIIGGVITLLKVAFDIYNKYLRDQKTDGEKITGTEKMDLILDKKMAVMDEKFLGAIRTLEATLGGQVLQLRDAWIDVKKNDLHSIYEKQKDQDQQYHNVALELREMRTIINLKLVAEKPKELPPG